MDIIVDYFFNSSLDKGEAVIFTRAIKCENGALLRRNRTYYTILKGTRATILACNTGSGPCHTRLFTVQIEKDRKVIGSVQEFLIERA